MRRRSGVGRRETSTGVIVASAEAPGGKGSVEVFLNGKFLRRVQVTEDRLYTLLDQGHDGDGRLDLHFTPGLSAYAFTFG